MACAILDAELESAKADDPGKEAATAVKQKLHAILGSFLSDASPVPPATVSPAEASPAAAAMVSEPPLEFHDDSHSLSFAGAEPGR